MGELLRNARFGHCPRNDDRRAILRCCVESPQNRNCDRWCFMGSFLVRHCEKIRKDFRGNPHRFCHCEAL